MAAPGEKITLLAGLNMMQPGSVDGAFTIESPPH